MDNLKLTILHCNDFHNSLYFRADKDYRLCGGISMLSDYVKRVRSEEKNTLFTISGDILQEDIMGSDYKGTNTVKVINQIKPDALSLGNHELDYGLAHLLIFKSCIEVPTLNANIYVEEFQIPLFMPSCILNAGNVRILAIGIIPVEFYKTIQSDRFCSNMLSYKESYNAIRDEISKYQDKDYDIIAILSHYGYEGDVLLAENMPEDIHINIILGGHSHIDMDKAEVINNIIYAQCSYGTTYIGRFDLEIDPLTHTVSSWKWERITISDDHCGFDPVLDELTDNIHRHRIKKTPNGMVAAFADTYHHERIKDETELGNLVADALLDIYNVDIIMLQNGSIRSESCGPLVTQNDLKNLFPYDDAFCEVSLSGNKLKEMFDYLASLNNKNTRVTTYYLYSKGFELVLKAYDPTDKDRLRVQRIKLLGKEIQDEKIYRIGVTKYALSRFIKSFNISISVEDPNVRILSYSDYADLEHYFLMQKEPVKAPETGLRVRII